MSYPSALKKVLFLIFFKYVIYLEFSSVNTRSIAFTYAQWLIQALHQPTLPFGKRLKVLNGQYNIHTLQQYLRGRQITFTTFRGWIIFKSTQKSIKLLELLLLSTKVGIKYSLLRSVKPLSVEAPCSLGCAGLTYCNQLNNRATSLFRSCSAQADLEAHLAVLEQKNSRYANYRAY